MNTTVVMTDFGGEASVGTRIAGRNEDTQSKGKTGNGGDNRLKPCNKFAGDGGGRMHEQRLLTFTKPSEI